MTIEQHNDGWITIYEIVEGKIRQERYLYYTKKEAIRKYKKKYK